jgi:hypothetical protein
MRLFKENICSQAVTCLDFRTTQFEMGFFAAPFVRDRHKLSAESSIQCQWQNTSDGTAAMTNGSNNTR